MKKVQPFSESNFLPSAANFEGKDGVSSRMSHDPIPYTVNGLSIDVMRDVASIGRHDTLDAVGLATLKMSESMKVYSESDFATAFARAVSKNKSNQSKGL